MQTETDPVSDLYTLDIRIEDCCGYSSGQDVPQTSSGNGVSTRGDAVSVSPDVAGNVFIAVYDSSGRLETTGYREGIGSDMTLLVDRNCSHTVLAYGNFGDRSATQQTTLDDALKEEYLFSWDKLRDGGCPMVKRENLSKGASSLSIRLDRILAKVTFSLDGNFPEGMFFSFDRVEVMNTNSRVSLFGSSAAQSADDIIPGDYTVTLSDPMVFYLPENLQGSLLPANTDPYRKNREELLSAGADPDLCSYMDVVLHQQDTYGVSGKRRFRFYLGGDNVGNFDIRRNSNYTVSLSLTSDGVNLSDNWKVDNSDLEDTRVLGFTKDNYNVVAGADTEIGVTYSFGGSEDGDYSFFQAADGWDFYDRDPRLTISKSSGKLKIRAAAGEVSLGEVIPLKIKTFDSIHKDLSQVTVTMSSIPVSWGSFTPSYIAQSGTLTAESIPPVLDGISFKAASGSEKLVRVENLSDGKSAKVSCLGAGTAVISIMGKSGDEEFEICQENLSIKSPVISCKPAVALQVSGVRTSTATAYKDENGNSMVSSTTKGNTFFDPDLYTELLVPVFTGASYGSVTSFIKSTGTSLYVGYLSRYGMDVTNYFGESKAGTMTVKPKGTEAARTVSATMSVYIEDPFPGASSSRRLGIVSNRWHAGLGVISNSVDITSTATAITGTTGLVASSSLQTSFTTAASDFSLTYSASSGLGIKRKSGTVPSCGKIAVKGSVLNTSAGGATTPVTIGYLDVHLICGIDGKAVRSIDYNVSAVFPEGIADGKVAEIGNALTNSAIFTYGNSDSAIPDPVNSNRYVYDNAYDDSGNYVPLNGDFETWGSWCDLVAYNSSTRAKPGATIYRLHVGRSDLSGWTGEDGTAYTMFKPQIAVDITKATLSGSDVGYTVSGGYRYYYLKADEKGYSGLPYVLLGFYNGSYTYTHDPYLSWAE